MRLTFLHPFYYVSAQLVQILVLQYQFNLYSLN